MVSAAASLVAKVRGSGFVDPSLLLSLTTPLMTALEVALFANPNRTRHIHIDDDNTINIWLPYSSLDSWLPQLQRPSEIRPQLDVHNIG